MTLGHVALVMPAYNEADGIEGFLAELVASFDGVADRLTIVVVDDRSTDGTADLLEASEIQGLVVRRQPQNGGHGPTALAAYQAGLACDADVLVHVDGDGQFDGYDVARVAQHLAIGVADVVHGVRRQRDDPWFRRVLSASLRLVVAAVARRGIRDVNTPLRAYRPDRIAELLDSHPGELLIPHVHFSIAEARRGWDVDEVEVRSRVRRGATATGTMWGGTRRKHLPTRRFVAFVARAGAEFVAATVRPHRATAPQRADQSLTETA
ncbi:glycosyltransferase family 2 protein [Microbacterium dauci]|uniref:Glycosyltransferase family 2 protein n=1 Tax=Microbacterium dauci TaxID=3048008 RepID=A0ABT6ZEB3_9MICO|nr:glycosyltransferase family 2 protein [Microbacterium sp. LX3-4]MDJ1114504.1 glycosyltransferase family 2 protein [Microbacterium sp. LX3-4]